MKFATFMSNNWQDISYAAALIERMYPNYCLFSEATEAGDSSVIRNGLDVIWSCCADFEQTVDFSKQQEKLEPVKPDLSALDFFGARPASDCCVALTLLFDVCAGNQLFSKQEFDDIYCSTVMAYLEFSGIDNDLDNHELILDAQAYFEEVSSQLAETKGEHKSIVKNLKSFVVELDVSNIGIVSK